MIHRESLKDLLSKPEYSKTDKLILCLAENASEPKSVKAIRELAKSAGLRSAERWNVSQLLSGSRGLAIRTDTGWELSSDGRSRALELAGSLAASPAPKVAASIRAHLHNLSSPDTRAFVEEAIRCFESGLFRAAVVLSWVGAVSVLYSHVHKSRLADFNTEASRRDPKWRPAKTADDLARMKEHELLGVLEAISVLGKSVKQELEVCLKLRNGCGHPNSLRIGENRVAAHIETLVLNVFSHFAV